MLVPVPWRTLGDCIVVHLLLLPGGLVGLLDELFEGEIVEDVVGGVGKFLIEETDGDFAGGHFGGNATFAQGQAAFESADHFANHDFARRAGEAVATFAADFAFEEATAAEDQQNCLEKLGGEAPHPARESAGLHVSADPSGPTARRPERPYSVCLERRKNYS